MILPPLVFLEMVSQFVMAMKLVYNKNFYFNEQNVFLNTAGLYVIKLFTVILTNVRNKLERLSLPNLMFASKAGAYPSKAPFRCSTLRLAIRHTYKNKTRLERPDRYNHYNLLGAFVKVL